MTTFDFELDEQCFEYTECSSLTPFTRAGKAVFEVEYNAADVGVLSQARALGFSSMKKDLDSRRRPPGLLIRRARSSRPRTFEPA